MRLSSIFYILTIAVLTSSCSSMYDSWQGYNDIEPITPSKDTYQGMREGKSELDEAVIRASIQNQSTNTAKTSRQVTQEQIDAIYARAGIKNPERISSDMPVPLVPSKTNQDLVAVKVADIPTAGTQKLGQLFDDEIAAYNEAEVVTPIIENVDEDSQSDTIIIGDVENIFEDNNDIVINDDALQIEINNNVTYDALVPTQNSQDDVVIIGESDNNETIIIGEDYNVSSSMEFLQEEIKYNKSSDRLSPKDISLLRNVVKQYKQGSYKVKVIGYAVVDTSDAIAQKLAEKRASKVAAILIKYGINVADITTSQFVSDTAADVTEIYFIN